MLLCENCATVMTDCVSHKRQTQEHEHITQTNRKFVPELHVVLVLVIHVLKVVLCRQSSNRGSDQMRARTKWRIRASRKVLQHVVSVHLLFHLQTWDWAPDGRASRTLPRSFTVLLREETAACTHNTILMLWRLPKRDTVWVKGNKKERTVILTLPSVPGSRKGETSFTFRHTHLQLQKHENYTLRVQRNLEFQELTFTFVSLTRWKQSWILHALLFRLLCLKGSLYKSAFYPTLHTLSVWPKHSKLSAHALTLLWLFSCCQAPEGLISSRETLQMQHSFESKLVLKMVPRRIITHFNGLCRLRVALPHVFSWSIVRGFQPPSAHSNRQILREVWESPGL